MVKIIGYKEVAKDDGTSFISLQVTGGLEMIQSANSGNFYAKLKTCRIPASFNAETAKSMVGQQIPGEIVRTECDEYEYVSRTTGEVIKLHYTYAYRPEGSMELIGQEPVKEAVSA